MGRRESGRRRWSLRRKEGSGEGTYNHHDAECLVGGAERRGQVRTGRGTAGTSCPGQVRRRLELTFSSLAMERSAKPMTIVSERGEIDKIGCFLAHSRR